MAVPLTTYKTPGVYVQEIRKLPPSIAQVDTAIPAFIGYTQKADRESLNDLEMKPTRIRSLNEYELYFGTTNPEAINISINTNSVSGRRSIKVNLVEPVKYYMYYALQMFYANGGGECFIISVGDLTDSVLEEQLIAGMNLLKENTDPTLILFPDAVSLDNDKYVVLMQDALIFCAKPQFTNFFLIMDVKHQHKDGIKNIDGTRQNVDADVEEFRKVAGSLAELKNGAAYYPHLLSSIPYETDSTLINITENTIDQETLTQKIARLTILEASLPAGKQKNDVNELLQESQAHQQLEDDSKTQKDLIAPKEAKLPPLSLKKETIGDILAAMETAIAEGKDAAELKSIAEAAATPVQALVLAIQGINIPQAPNDNAVGMRNAIKVGIELSVIDQGDDLAAQIQKLKMAIADVKKNALVAFQAAANEGVYTNASLDIIASVDNALYNEILTELSTVNGSVVMPPSSAMAGVYARIDSSRGVFQSPANIGLGAAVRPYRNISDEIQNGLNVDTRAGKSINCIRSFPGRGMLVWGARTLAGNDREWRYISVVRFFKMVEESTKRALMGFVFEPNNLNTWISVRASIESFLETQWRAGALLGSKPEDAFFVRVGLHETFTEAEMLDGFMVVEIGMAVVRPAEFIVLKFMHKFELGQN